MIRRMMLVHGDHVAALANRTCPLFVGTAGAPAFFKAKVAQDPKELTMCDWPFAHHYMRMSDARKCGFQWHWLLERPPCARIAGAA